MQLPDLPIPLHALRLERLSLQVSLGCSPEERARPQEVRFTVEFRFHQAPRGAYTDSLQDTICYAEVSAALQKLCESKPYQLIEKLALEAYVILREYSGGRADVGLSLQKVRPPIVALQGGSWYRCGDFWV